MWPLTAAHRTMQRLCSRSWSVIPSTSERGGADTQLIAMQLSSGRSWPVWRLSRGIRRKAVNTMHYTLIKNIEVNGKSTNTGWSKKVAHFCTPYYFIKYWPIFKLFHCQNQDKICNNTITKDPTAPQVCRYTIFRNISVLKATIENTTTSLATHFKSGSSSSKADTLNIWCKNCRMRQLL